MNTDDGFISPVAETHRPRPAAARPPSLDGARIALVDCMLNPSGMWGQGILDAAQDSIRERWREITFDRVPRPQVGGEPAEGWARTMAQHYAALVIAAGD